jgi:hypothetical protein
MGGGREQPDGPVRARAEGCVGPDGTARSGRGHGVEVGGFFLLARQEYMRRRWWICPIQDSSVENDGIGWTW